MESSEQLQYSRRDDNGGSTSYQHHQNLLAATHLQNAAHPSSHSSIFSVAPNHPSPILKRKPEPSLNLTSNLQKRRREDDIDSFDIDPNNQGAKHWTDDEKTKLFTWLMGPGQDEHWNSLRATKNSCLRECAIQVFDGKKSYQALKGCYERNFNLFKQIYVFEDFCARSSVGVLPANESECLREYDRRLQAARKADCDIGNLNSRTIDHWHRMGWYNLFYERWQSDPQTSRPTQARNSTANGAHSNADEPDMDDNSQINFSRPVIIPNGVNTNNLLTDRSHQPLTYLNPQNLREAIIPPTSISPYNPPAQQQRNGSGSCSAPSAAPPSSNAPVNGPLVSTLAPAVPSTVLSTNSEQQQQMMMIPHAVIQAYLQYLQVQTQTSKMKLEYLRRREEREELESAQRREAERLKMEREAEAYQRQKHKDNIQQKTEKALEMLQSQVVDDGVKQAAGDFLKTLFTNN